MGIDPRESVRNRIRRCRVEGFWDQFQTQTFVRITVETAQTVATRKLLATVCAVSMAVAAALPGARAKAAARHPLYARRGELRLEHSLGPTNLYILMDDGPVTDLVAVHQALKWRSGT